MSVSGIVKPYDPLPKNRASKKCEFCGKEDRPMKKSRYTAEQIAFALRQAETGTPVPEVCRKMGTCEQSFYRWKKKYIGMGVPMGFQDHERGAAMAEGMEQPL